MEEIEQAKFEGFAIVDVMGHQRYIGKVSTQAFGQAVVFRVDVPSLPERQRTLKYSSSVDGRWCPVGTVVQEQATPGYTKLIGSGSIYMISPCTEEAAMEALEQAATRKMMLIALPPEKQLEAAQERLDEDEDDEEDEEDGDSPDDLYR